MNVKPIQRSYLNAEGYLDKTAGAAMRNKRQPGTGTIRPLPKKEKVYDMTKPLNPAGMSRPKTWEVFLHYKGYHNQDLGIWVRVNGYTEEEAKSVALCQTITTKQVEVSVVLRK